MASGGYIHSEDYMDGDFFSRFSFFTSPDPTHGAVQYVNYSYAVIHGLVRTDVDGIYLGPDMDNELPLGHGRPSVRIQSKAVYNGGLFIVKVGHVPEGCGAWPAFWMYGADEQHAWPAWGEFDIIEGAHFSTRSLSTLHTGPGCSQESVKEGEDFNGGWLHATPKGAPATNCDIHGEGQWYNQGCSQQGPQDSMGGGFNKRGGGTFAAEWDPEAGHMRLWFWPAGFEPSDILVQQPEPDSWGRPISFFRLADGICPAGYFQNMKIVFDLTFCGDLAGPTFQEVCGAPDLTCDDFVAQFPQAFAEAYWKVHGLDVFVRSGAGYDGVASTTTQSITNTHTTTSRTTTRTSTTQTFTSTTVTRSSTTRTATSTTLTSTTVTSTTVTSTTTPGTTITSTTTPASTTTKTETTTTLTTTTAATSTTITTTSATPEPSTTLPVTTTPKRATTTAPTTTTKTERPTTTAPTTTTTPAPPATAAPTTTTPSPPTAPPATTIATPTPVTTTTRRTTSRPPTTSTAETTSRRRPATTSTGDSGLGDGQIVVRAPVPVQLRSHAATPAAANDAGIAVPPFVRFSSGVCNGINSNGMNADFGLDELQRRSPAYVWQTYYGGGSGSVLACGLVDAKACSKVCAGLSECHFFAVGPIGACSACLVHRACPSASLEGWSSDFTIYEIEEEEEEPDIILPTASSSTPAPAPTTAATSATPTVVPTTLATTLATRLATSPTPEEHFDVNPGPPVPPGPAVEISTLSETAAGAAGEGPRLATLRASFSAAAAAARASAQAQPHPATPLGGAHLVAGFAILAALAAVLGAILACARLGAREESSLPDWSAGAMPSPCHRLLACEVGEEPTPLVRREPTRSGMRQEPNEQYNTNATDKLVLA